MKYISLHVITFKKYNTLFYNFEIDFFRKITKYIFSEEPFKRKKITK